MDMSSTSLLSELTSLCCADCWLLQLSVAWKLCCLSHKMFIDKKTQIFISKKWNLIITTLGSWLALWASWMWHQGQHQGHSQHNQQRPSATRGPAHGSADHHRGGRCRLEFSKVEENEEKRTYVDLYSTDVTIWFSLMVWGFSALRELSRVSSGWFYLNSEALLERRATLLKVA